MVILDRPFVSDMMADTLQKNNIPVLRNAMSELRVSNGKLLNDSEFSEEYKTAGKIYTVSENALGWIYEHIDDKRFIDSISLVKD